MIICICNRVSDKEIKEKLDADKSIKEVEDLQEKISICNNCSCCYFAIQDLIYNKNEIKKSEDNLESIFDIIDDNK